MIHDFNTKEETKYKEAMKEFKKNELLFSQEVGICQKWLKRYHINSFLPEFFKINIQIYATHATKDFEYTIVKKNCSLHTKDIFLVPLEAESKILIIRSTLKGGCWKSNHQEIQSYIDQQRSITTNIDLKWH